MVTPTCGETQTFIFVRFRDKDAGCGEGSGRRPSAHYYEKEEALMVIAAVLNVQQHVTIR